MKRNMDLIRELLIFFDEKPGPEPVRVPDIDGFDEAMIKYNLVLMYDAGYISCETMKSSTSDRVYEVWPFELKWRGHELLDKIRNPLIWDEIKIDLRKKGFLTASVGIIKKLADEAIRKRLNLKIHE